MSILTRYILARFFGAFAFSWGALALLVYLGDLFGKINHLMTGRAPTAVVIEYLVLRIPYWTVRVIPAATLLAVLFLVTDFVRRGEFLAIQASGFRPGRLFRPLILLSLALACGHLVAQETVVPAAYLRAEHLWRERIHSGWGWDYFSDGLAPVRRNQMITFSYFYVTERPLDRLPVILTLLEGKASAESDEMLGAVLREEERPCLPDLHRLREKGEIAVSEAGCVPIVLRLLLKESGLGRMAKAGGGRLKIRRVLELLSGEEVRKAIKETGKLELSLASAERESLQEVLRHLTREGRQCMPIIVKRYRRTGELKFPPIFTRPIMDFYGRDGLLARQVDAQVACWDADDGRWIFHDGAERTFEKGKLASSRQFAREDPGVRMSPDELRPRKRETCEETGILGTWRRIRWLGEHGLSQREARASLQAKAAYPFTNLILCAFGIPMALLLRRANRAVSFVAALGIAFAFEWSITVARTVARSGFPPAVAAWTPLVAFGIVAWYLMRRCDR
ncbi:LptF/LptG family permease [Elusimicrobiota bacterium]